MRLSTYLLEKTTQHRLGMLPAWVQLKPELCDISSYYNYALPADEENKLISASGSLSQNPEQALTGAIAEALERYVARYALVLEKKLLKQGYELGSQKMTHFDFALYSKEQWQNPRFPFYQLNSEEVYYAPVSSTDGKIDSCWVPHELVYLNALGKASHTIPSTSTGLAAHFNFDRALISGIQELLERDALACTWLNTLSPPTLKIPAEIEKEVSQKQGQIYAFDLTQKFNPHSVIAILGYIPRLNQKRISFGVACRKSKSEAFQKAYQEWLQGVCFAGTALRYPELIQSNVDALDSFEAHGLYYTFHPELFEKIPLLGKRKEISHWDFENLSLREEENIHSQTEKETLLEVLRKENIRFFYRELTSIDVAQTGLQVLRVLSPDLNPLHAHEALPFLGGRLFDVAWRYPHLAEQAKYPNPYPHPLP